MGSYPTFCGFAQTVAFSDNLRKTRQTLVRVPFRPRWFTLDRCLSAFFAQIDKSSAGFAQAGEGSSAFAWFWV